MAVIRRPQGTAFWLRDRNVVCPNCLDREQRILEYPFANIPSQRCSPHDSRYLVTVGYKSLSMANYQIGLNAVVRHGQKT